MLQTNLVQAHSLKKWMHLMKEWQPFEYKLGDSHLTQFAQHQRTISKLGIDHIKFAELHSFSLQNFFQYKKSSLYQNLKRHLACH